MNVRQVFSLAPANLRARRRQCGPEVEQLCRATRDTRTSCNICGSQHGVYLANRDRYGFPVSTVICPRCGLVYLRDRLTYEAYLDFYGAGKYRNLTNKFNGDASRMESVRQNQQSYAAHVIYSLQSWAELPASRFLLDIGGSAGFIANAVAAKFGCDATVLDPSVEEVAAAESIGLKGTVGTLESFETENKYGIILLCRSIEHLFDLRGSLQKIHGLLRPDGLFFCDCIDFLETCRTTGAPESVTKIDHCYWLCPETAPAIFRALGFEIVSTDVGSQPGVVGYLLRRCEPTGFVNANEVVIEQIIRRLREISSDWHRAGQLPAGNLDRLRRAAYRAKRKVIKAFSSNGGAVDASARRDAAGSPRIATLNERHSSSHLEPSHLDSSRTEL